MTLPLRSLDLFSGIGGITHALRGIAEPLAYCDVWKVSREVLQARMDDGDLPHAPISSDVRTLSAEWLSSQCSASVDMVVGGFPCVGFSTSGLRKGFENEQSGLFVEVLRILDEFQPRFAFLENVQNILSIGMTTVATELINRGYQLRYCSAPAYAVGAPQKRMRWFCLAFKDPADIEQLRALSAAHPCQRFSWEDSSAPVRMAHDHAPGRKQRIGLLGNSVVPDCVRFSFEYLIHCDDEVLRRVTRTKPLTEKHDWPSAGFVTAERDIYRLKGPTGAKPPSARYVLDPSTYVYPEEKLSPYCTSARITQPVSRNLWPTPRHGSGTASHLLTERSSRDIETFARFESSTPDAVRSGKMTGEFCEWLMGYPKGWTLPVSRVLHKAEDGPVEVHPTAGA